MSLFASEQLGHSIKAQANLVLGSSTNVPGYQLCHANGSSAQVATFGATVVQYHHHHPSSTCTTPENLLFLSASCITDESKPLRGGIPLVFPIFNAGVVQGDDGLSTQPEWAKNMPSHGFARRRHWHLVDGETQISESGPSLTLVLHSDAETQHVYPFTFILQYTITLSADALHTRLDVKNTSESSMMPAQALLHTYYNVPITNVSLRGLAQQAFLDQLMSRKCQQESEKLEHIDRETDRIYAQSPDVLELCSGSYRLDIQKHASLSNHGSIDRLPSDVVVWNPWIDKAKRMSDFGDEEYQEMICIEPGLVHQYVHIPPQESLTLSQTIRIADVE